MSEDKMFDEESLKRLVRTLNSVFNLYDVEAIPIEIIEMLCEPVWNIVKILNIPIKLKSDNETIDKFIMPEDFETWFETNGRISKK